MNLETINVNEIVLSKFALELAADQLAEKVEAGQVDALDAAVKINALEQLVKLVKDRIKGHVLDGLQKHPKQKASVHGAEVSVMESIKYDYSHITDWVNAELLINELKARQKAMEDEEKKWRRGELPVKSCTTTFKINLPK